MSRSFSISTLHIYLFLGLLLLAGCVAHEKTIPSLHNKHSQLGMASWYGPSFHGKPSASGEPYDMWALTAAHRTLPFGTWVQVTKVETGKRVTVRINDRGPFIKGRIIDLSYGAARELAMIGEGTADVSLAIVSPPNASIPSIRAPSRFWVQAGAFTTLMEAMTLRERLATQYDLVRVQTVNLPSGEWHRVQVGAFPSKKTAQSAARALQNDFGGNPLILISN
ncbi:MAG: septal ring lytic transglycosylase RlpA family protein [Nitrospirales bacterium]